MSADYFGWLPAAVFLLSVFWFCVGAAMAGCWVRRRWQAQRALDLERGQERVRQALRLAGVFADAQKGIYTVPANRRGRGVERQRVFLFPAEQKPKRVWRFQ